MKYISVCSGIEAATVAWHGLGWKAAAYSEIEAFPSAVLAHHYPDIPNVGDMTKFKEWNIEPGTIDLLVGGTPCQSFSVAGLRKGLADPRGNLALTYCGILDHLKPRWFVWENVPGVLSSGGGRDFGSFLGAVAELGYGFAYRVLDAQYFGVAQRRRRVFVVGYLGDWRPAAKVLFEPESLRRDTAPSREKGQRVAPCVTNGAPFSRTGNERVEADAMVAQPYPVANTLIARMHKGINSTVDEGQTPVMQPIALQDITPREKAQNGRGWNDDGTAYTVDTAATQGVAQPINIYGGNKRADRPEGGFYIRMNEETSKTLDAASGLNPTCSQGGTAVLAPTLTASNDPSRSPQSSEITAQVAAVVQATAVYSFIQASDQPKSTNSVLEGMANTLTSRVGNTGFLGVPAPINQNATAAVAYKTQCKHCIKFFSQYQCSAPTHGECDCPKCQGYCKCHQEEQPAICIKGAAIGRKPEAGPQYGETLEEMTYTQNCVDVHGVLTPAMQVRRLTPVECERLQGFPDNYTAIPWRGKAETPDGPRYKALGNSMAVPVMAWIGRRIQEFEAGNAS